MAILNRFINDISKHLAIKASRISSEFKKFAISFGEIQTRVRLIPQHVISEGTKSITKFPSRKSLQIIWLACYTVLSRMLCILYIKP